MLGAISTQVSISAHHGDLLASSAAFGVLEYSTGHVGQDMFRDALRASSLSLSLDAGHSKAHIGRHRCRLGRHRLMLGRRCVGRPKSPQRARLKLRTHIGPFRAISTDAAHDAAGLGRHDAQSGMVTGQSRTGVF